MAPLVSVLIPCYNAQRWIADTIESVRQQTWKRTEIIVVDDSSTDSTLHILRHLKSPSLKVVHHARVGANNARNIALNLAQGDYIQWLDADDLLGPDKIAEQVRILGGETSSDPWGLCACSWARFFYRPSKGTFWPTPLWCDLSPVEWLVRRLSNPWIMPCHAWLLGRDLAAATGPWDARLVANTDGEYFTRVVSRSRHVAFSPMSKCYYRFTLTPSMSNATSRRAWESRFLSVQLMVDHVLALQDTEYTRKACMIRLNKMAAFIEPHTPDLAQNLRYRIIELGGKIEHITQKSSVSFLKAVFGPSRIQPLKDLKSRLFASLQIAYDKKMYQWFGPGDF